MTHSPGYTAEHGLTTKALSVHSQSSADTDRDACRHDKHLEHTGKAVKTEWLCTCLYITAGGGWESERVQVKEVMTQPLQPAHKSERGSP